MTEKILHFHCFDIIAMDFLHAHIEFVILLFIFLLPLFTSTTGAKKGVRQHR